MATSGTQAAADMISDTTGRLTSASRNLDDRLTLNAMRMTLIAFSFFFACFYFALTYLQLLNPNNMWKPAGIHQPSLVLGVTETGLVLLAGLVYFWGQWAGLYRGNFARLRIGLWVASLLGFLAIILHVIELRKPGAGIGIFGIEKHHPGFGTMDGGFATCFIGIQGVYTVFLIIAVIVMLGVANRARLGLFERSGIAIETFGEFWGWMSAIALLNFLALWIQPFLQIA